MRSSVKRILLALGLIVGAAAWSWLLAAMARQSGHAPAAHVTLPDLDELEARMLWAEERRRAWEELVRRHQQISEVACGQLAAVATARETWTEGR